MTSVKTHRLSTKLSSTSRVVMSWKLRFCPNGCKRSNHSNHRSHDKTDLVSKNNLLQLWSHCKLIQATWIPSLMPTANTVFNQNGIGMDGLLPLSKTPLWMMGEGISLTAEVYSCWHIFPQTHSPGSHRHTFTDATHKSSLGHKWATSSHWIATFALRMRIT